MTRAGSGGSEHRFRHQAGVTRCRDAGACRAHAPAPALYFCGVSSGPSEENFSCDTTRLGGQVMLFGGHFCPVFFRNQAGGSYIGGS